MGKRHPRQHRGKCQKLVQRYGITLCERDDMLARQMFRCASCHSDKPGPTDWHVDHDHSTGKVRGIICNDCNLALGLACDDPDILRKLTAYLEKYR